MFDAVRNGRSRYTEEQRAAWVPAPRSGPEWDQRLGSQDVILAEAEGDIVGFMSLAPGGYIDFAYIRPRAQGTGLFRLLYEQLLQRARENSERRLWVHASLMAQPAFRALGFVVVCDETVFIGDQAFDRSEMELEL
ncbi:GNAT family N-acetyltransferase [Brevundimonas sp. DWR2-3-1b1]|uniref:GNAT family N-acetyltransferase n=1 Tax=unclassified Brevundimonas TaxID=2622653 RepID=UPI003CEC86C9